MFGDAVQGVYMFDPDLSSHILVNTISGDDFFITSRVVVFNLEMTQRKDYLLFNSDIDQLLQGVKIQERSKELGLHLIYLPLTNEEAETYGLLYFLKKDLLTISSDFNIYNEEQNFKKIYYLFPKQLKVNELKRYEKLSQFDINFYIKDPKELFDYALRIPDVDLELEKKFLNADYHLVKESGIYLGMNDTIVNIFEFLQYALEVSNTIPETTKKIF